MLRPVTWASKPRRTTSTSGSSGTFQSVPRRGGGLEFGLLLGPADALAVLDVGDDDRRGEFLVVVRAGGGHHIRRRSHAARGGQLLQAAFPVQPGPQRRRGVEQRDAKSQEYLAGHT